MNLADLAGLYKWALFYSHVVFPYTEKMHCYHKTFPVGVLPVTKQLF